ncbi:hypothetical protein [uncultured Lacinutrix sp.]|nr:hypothetical protein [uncultured Lacinutrix sp.]
MKNIKRLFLLATLIIVATVVFSSEYDELKSQLNTTIVANK